MSQHPSLKIDKTSTEQRTVLKRYEKVKVLHEKKLWTDPISIFHLPKVKTVRIKIKKAAEAPKEEAPAAAAPASATTGTAATPKK